jgi:preprotein translocase subunit SecG
MLTFIVILILIVAVLLVGIVLIQNSKGGGLSSQFIGAGAGQIMGVKRTGDLLEQITWGLIIVLMTLTLLSNVFLAKGSSQEGEIRSVNKEKAAEKIITPQPVTPQPVDTTKK